MSIQKIIQESIAGNPLEMKEALAEELRNRVAESIAAKMEEVERIDELSRDTLTSYASKANLSKSKAQANMRVTAGGQDFATHKKRFDKRDAGAKLAGSKIRKKIGYDEEVEQIDEISKKTLGSYVKKASSDMANNAYNLGARDPLKKPGSWDKAFKRKAGIEKATDRLANEEVEQIDELKKSTLGSYIKKASTDQIGNTARVLAGKNDPETERVRRRMGQRMSGIAKATDKLTKEEVEDLEEISRKTLGSYVKKAGGADRNSLAQNIKTQMSAAAFGDKETYKQSQRAANNRSTGIQRAADRLAKEEVEQIEEISKKTMGSYVNKAADDISQIQRDITSSGTKSPDYKNLSRMRRNRKAGIATAVKKLTKE